MTHFFSARPCLVVVDIQERLLRAMPDPQSLVHACTRLLRGARLLGMPICFFQQNPEGLGPVPPELRDLAGDAPLFTKNHFSGHTDKSFRIWLEALGKREVAICGMETHVCVAQTAMGLVRDGFQVHGIRDVMASRHPGDRETGLLRMQAFGVFPVSVEGLLFEVLGRADVPEFKDFLEIVK
ncbi:isochorismatase family protein [Desulfobotulus sp.]|uniref:isochorismatase family protein n=1 Tax=Desulfobotulus sp. TaxID=1940337 RepID=UPI002A369836|nr:isochorismatase family protein [Desulfobotulus sp.]MDY0163209.1 isochorismatase family protein [Desulfobotulus sp.]